MAKTRVIELTNGSRLHTKQAALAAAAAGGAAVAGKLAWDRLHCGSEADLAREYRLHDGESVADGIRRIARGRLDNAVEGLEGASDRELGEAVHEARKSLKRLRACLRVVRPTVGAETYQRENAAFRQAGRRLAGARDAAVLIETLDGITQGADDELPDEATARLRAALEAEHELAIEALRLDGLRPVLVELRSARQRTAGWTFEAGGFEALEPGLRRVYRRGRRRMRAAASEPSDENLHEWRKRVKDLWHASQIVRAAAPKRMRRFAQRAHRLSDLLGEDHDLAVLRDRVEHSRGRFDDPAAQAALVGMIDRRRQRLQDEAFKRGAKLYKQSPKRFAASIESRWQKRAPEERQPAAA
jgi:CHAD domain-containing protein